MPVRQYKPTRPPDQAKLVRRLIQEWKTPNKTASEPVILEEKDNQGKVVHVYVVWSDWAHLGRVHRGEIIMDAAQKVKPNDQAFDITIAMGLTPEEAGQFGIKWR